MQIRLSKPETFKFRSDLAFNQINLILKKDKSVIIPPLKAFYAEKINLQHKIFENERIVFKKLQNMHIYCKNCKKHTGNSFSKQLVLISRNKT